MTGIRALVLNVLMLFLVAAHVHARVAAPTDWRWRNDDGNLESATWAADENSEATLVGHRDLIRLRTHMSGTYDPSALKVSPEGNDAFQEYTAFFEYGDSVHLTGNELTFKLLSRSGTTDGLANNPTFNDGGECVVMKGNARTITVPDIKYQELEICLKAREETPEGTYTFLIPNIHQEAMLEYLHARYADVATSDVTEIKGTAVTGNGEITDLGLRNPVQHGVCWSVSPNPTIEDSRTEEGGVSETGSFKTRVTGLEEGTTYYLRAYATNSAGTVYGEQVDFTTGKAKESYGPGGCFVGALQ